MVIEIFKIVNDFAPSYLSTIFEMSQSPYDMRHKSRLVQPKVNSTSYGLKSFKYYGSHIWNLLRTHIKSAMSLPEFKELLTTWSGLCANVHYAPYCSELMIFYWSVFSFWPGYVVLYFNSLTKWCSPFLCFIMWVETEVSLIAVPHSISVHGRNHWYFWKST